MSGQILAASTTGYPTRNVPLDAMRVVLAIMVVALHGHLLEDSYPEVSNALVNYLFRVAVPFFFMVNGYFFCRLLARGSSPLPWAKRILALYVTWTVVYGYFIAAHGVANGTLILLRGYWHLWYLPATLVAGLLVYRMRTWSSGRFAAALALAYVTGLGMQYVGAYHVFTGFVDQALNHAFTYRNFLFFGLPMFGVGFLLARNRAGEQVPRAALVALLAAAVALIVGEWAVNTSHGMRSPIDLLVGLPLFCAALLGLTLKARPVPLAVDLAALSGLIYFAHPLFLLLLPRVGVQGTVPLVIASVAGCLALYPAVGALNRRWPVFL